MINLLTLIPTKYKILIGLSALVIALSTVYYLGRKHVHDLYEVKILEQEKLIQEIQTKQAEVTVKVVTEYVDRVKIVKEKGDQIVKYVDRYITAEDDAKCSIPTKFVSLHDAAAANEVPDTASLTNDRASEVKLSELGKTVTENYSTCYQIREQLIGLQTWVKEQHAVK
jgi:hypothetical protein